MQSQGETQPIPPLNEWQQQMRDYHLRKAVRIITKFCLRSFMGNFKSLVFQRLQTAQKRPQATNTDWKFRQLFQKTKKTEHDALLIEYLHMLATTIQASFKGYLVRKRHKIASQKLNRFVSLLGAVVKGWKTRNILRCLKIREEAKSLGLKRVQAEKEGRTNDNPRRFEYLKRSLKAESMHFLRHFEELYITGGWVYEPREKVKVMQKWKNKKPQVKKELAFAPYEQQVETVRVQKQRQEEAPPKKKRVRQMRDGARKGRAKEPQPEQKEQIATTNASVANSAAYSEAPTSFREDRPIQAKGAYNYAEQDNLSNISKARPAETVAQSNELPEDDDKKTQLKKIEKKKLEKRQKYDPRKAIEEEKKRKKQEEQNKKEEQTNVQKKVEPEQPKQKVSSKDKSKDKGVVQSKSQRVIKTEKEENLRSTVNYPKNKGKVEAKIDCWGNRKTIAKKPSQQYSIKAKTIQVEVEEQQKSIELVPLEKLAAKIQQRRIKEKEKLQYSEEREKARIYIEKGCEEIKENFQRNKEQSQVSKYLKAQALKERQRVAEQTRQRRNNDTIYRSVQELSETYKNQYSFRYQNLQPKLSLLAAARKTEQSSAIPVLTIEGDYVERMMQQNQLLHRFRHTIGKMNGKMQEFLSN